MPVECNWVGDYEDPAKLNRENRRGEWRRVECICAPPEEPVGYLLNAPVSVNHKEISACARINAPSSLSLILPVISITEGRNKRG